MGVLPLQMDGLFHGKSIHKCMIFGGSSMSGNLELMGYNFKIVGDEKKSFSKPSVHMGETIKGMTWG